MNMADREAEYRSDPTVRRDDPSPLAIARHCERIRATWSPAELAKRSLWALCPAQLQTHATRHETEPAADDGVL